MFEKSSISSRFSSTSYSYGYSVRYQLKRSTNIRTQKNRRCSSLPSHIVHHQHDGIFDSHVIHRKNQNGTKINVRFLFKPFFSSSSMVYALLRAFHSFCVSSLPLCFSFSLYTHLTSLKADLWNSQSDFLSSFFLIIIIIFIYVFFLLGFVIFFPLLLYCICVLVINLRVLVGQSECKWLSSWYCTFIYYT